MSIYKDALLIVDIEATCWENNANPPDQPNEIIEIGVCVLDVARRELIEKRSLLVKPVQSEISPFCTQLTTLTAEIIAQEGMDFYAACAILEADFKSRSRLWTSWGMYDFNIFHLQCKTQRVRYPFSKKHANIKRLFTDVFKERMGMGLALEKAALPLEGTHHRGHDDAWNIGRLLIHLMEKQPDILRKYGL